MRWMRHVVLTLGLLCIAQGLAYASAGPFSERSPDTYYNCSHGQVAGSFTANSAKYSSSGSCTLVDFYPKTSFPWTAQGFYDARTANGEVVEKIVFNGPHPFRGEFKASMVCNNRRTGASFDPWLWMGDDKCAQIQIQATGEQSSGEMAGVFVRFLLIRSQERGRPVTASFPYDRRPLLAKRVNDLRAEAEALAAEKRRAEQLLQGATLPSGPSGPYTSLIHPSVLEPKAGQILAPQRPVPIKLVPPKGWDVSEYTVTIQRKDPNGTWVNHTSIPIGAIIAHSPTGYTGFGGGAPPAFLMTPGKWRLSAQASSPKQSGVSEWVEFTSLESADFTAKKRPSSILPSIGQSTMQSTLPPQGLPGVVDSQPSVLYSIASTGALKWYRHNGAQTGAGLKTPGAWTGPTDVGSGWQSFTQVVPGGGNVLYGITPDGTLKWYSHDDAKNGTPAWQGAKNVGTGWQNFKDVFSGSEGILYAITPDGTLKWYHHTGYRDGAVTWEGPKNVGNGWQNFKNVFGMGGGIIYAISGDGKLKWYKHTGFQNGTMTWEGPKDVGTGWQNFKQVFGAGNGIIYGIAGNGILKWHKHTGYRDGTFSWEGAKDIGTGWQGFTKVVSLLPLSATAAAVTAIALAETVEESRPGNWVTWNYLAMHHPEIVAQALADIQTQKLPRTSIAGLASEVELNDLFKTNWTAEVSRLNAMREAGTTPAGITPRGLPDGISLKDQVSVIPSVKTPLSPTAKAIRHNPFPVTLPPRNLGSVWAGQQARTVVSITAPADGYVEGRFNLNATNRHFRIVNAKAYTGVLTKGKALDVSLTIPGGQYQDVVPDPANPPAQISKAGLVAVMAKKGQRIDFTIAFEPVALGMTPVGDNEATLELSGATSSDINILSPNTPATTWTRIAPIRARFEGINFGVIGTIDNTAIIIFRDTTPCNQVVPVPAGITLFNAEKQVRSVSVTGESLAPVLHLQPLTVSLAPGERKQVPIPLQIASCPDQGIEHTGTIKYAYADVVRRANFGVTLYPNIHHWNNENSHGSVGSCDYTWDIYIHPDGTTSFAWSLRNRNLVFAKKLFLYFSVLGQQIGRGFLSDGQNTVHTKFRGYTITSSFVRDNYVRLLAAPARVELTCSNR